ncbi:hypothetical protein COV11_01970 [Candidatus Woesearchaeota archaeon CG10_big_fil_rev_8_21_14_0_10_30_7]|nr:MAG: hypothetical protein COV11_01970 [Candidatus Woesearchaeota archaeon CG10_big_fil_rev_8_21_14_0_10_30_7]
MWGYHLCTETLANELRLSILETLKKQPTSVTELSKKVNAERSTVSHALDLLKKCSLVNAEKQGKQMIYSLNDTPLIRPHKNKDIFQIIDEHKDEHCPTCHKCE